MVEEVEEEVEEVEEDMEDMTAEEAVIIEIMEDVADIVVVVDVVDVEETIVMDHPLHHNHIIVKIMTITVMVVTMPGKINLVYLTINNNR